MPFMKQGQPWLYDETTGDVIGVKDPDGSERFFLSRRKTEVAWVNLSTPIVLAADTNYNMVALLKAITDAPPPTRHLGAILQHHNQQAQCF